MMEIGYHSAEPEAADLHAARSVIDDRRHAMRFEVPLPVWCDQQRFSAFLDHKADPGRASNPTQCIYENMDAVCFQIK